MACWFLYFSCCVWLLVTPGTVAHQVPLSVRFPRQEYWNRLLFPSKGDLPDSGIKPASSALTGGFFTTEPPGKPNRWLEAKKPSWVRCPGFLSKWSCQFLKYSEPSSSICDMEIFILLISQHCLENIWNNLCQTLSLIHRESCLLSATLNYHYYYLIDLLWGTGEVLTCHVLSVINIILFFHLGAVLTLKRYLARISSFKLHINSAE